MLSVELKIRYNQVGDCFRSFHLLHHCGTPVTVFPQEPRVLKDVYSITTLVLGFPSSLKIAFKPPL